MYDDPDYLNEPEIDRSKLKYVLYVRKSTQDESRQIRSIPDQIADCEIVAKRLEIKLSKPYLIETKSAKKPNQRKVFSSMLADIRKGKYDGIMAWHPDRLARNMREGGEIIDMVDEGYLKDLCFVTHHFKPDANGKMLLGMAFVLSKQYSDDLSQKVTRGVRRGLGEGKSSGTPKHGYDRERGGVYVPNKDNFDIVAEAWKMRLQGAPYREIADYMNNVGYGRVVKDIKSKRYGKKLTMDFRRLPTIFSDSFYYGVLFQKGKMVDLRDIPGYNFIPMITEQEWQTVQRMGGKTYRNKNISSRKTFYPLKGMVLCSYCERPMRAGASTGSKGKRYMSYRCDTVDCLRVKRSVRAKVVFNYLYEFLGDGLRLTEKDYDKYFGSLKLVSTDKINKLKQRLHSMEGALKSVNTNISERSLAIVGYDKSTKIWEINNAEILRLETQAIGLEADITKLKDTLSKTDVEAISLEQFLNLSKYAGSKLESANAVAKDRICRMIFLNLTVNEENVVSYHLKEPFKTALESKIFLNGRG